MLDVNAETTTQELWLSSNMPRSSGKKGAFTWTSNLTNLSGKTSEPKGTEPHWSERAFHLGHYSRWEPDSLSACERLNKANYYWVISLYSENASAKEALKKIHNFVFYNSNFHSFMLQVFIEHLCRIKERAVWSTTRQKWGGEGYLMVKGSHEPDLGGHTILWGRQFINTASYNNEIWWVLLQNS